MENARRGSVPVWAERVDSCRASDVFCPVRARIGMTRRCGPTLALLIGHDRGPQTVIQEYQCVGARLRVRDWARHA